MNFNFFNFDVFHIFLKLKIFKILDFKIFIKLLVVL